MTSPTTPDRQQRRDRAEAHAAASDDVGICHDSERSRFVAMVDGHQGVVDYEKRDGVMIITHTIVPAAIGGRGIAGRLNAVAMDHARQHGLKVSAQCSYTAAWLQRHPELAELRA